MAQCEALTDEQRMTSGKKIIHLKMDRRLALDLEACVNCGYFSETCRFYQSTQDPLYAPSRKLDQIDTTGADTMAVACGSCHLN